MPHALNEIWHVDTTLIRLIDGSWAYLWAVVDFSRRILAGNVAGTFHPGITAQLLLDAAKSVTSGKPMLLVDGGVENFNSAVDEVVESGLLTRVLAQTEITFSNSLIESWWRVLKHRLNSSELLRNSGARPPFSELDTVSDENSRGKLHNVLANSCAE